MNILIDADGCPVVGLTLQIAKRFCVPVIILCDTSHRAALAQWFWDWAEEIGGRFDRRNGCPNYGRQLRAVRRS